MKSSIEFSELKGINIYEVKISLKVNKKNIIKKTNREKIFLVRN